MRDVRPLIAAKTARWWTPDGVDGEKPTVDEVTVLEVRLYAAVKVTTG